VNTKESLLRLSTAGRAARLRSHERAIHCASMERCMQIENGILAVDKREFIDAFADELEQLMNDHEHIYIGVTTNPDRRAEQHDVSWSLDWDRMLLVYEAYTPGIAADLERALIDLARDMDDEKVLNESDGGENTQFQSGHVFLYLLLR
jgi:hypothetical protein